MRWWSIPIVIALGWFLYTLTPFWALYDLAAAVQAHDVRYVEQHVNFRTLRGSLIQQLTAALKVGSADAAPKDRERIADAATILAVPLAETLVTPQMVVDLLDDGWPQSLDIANPAPDADPKRDGLTIANTQRLVDFYVASQMRGFRTVVLAVPPGRSPAKQFKVRMRLRGWTWRLIDIELNPALRDRISAAIARAAKPRGTEPKPSGESPAETGSSIRP